VTPKFRILLWVLLIALPVDQLSKFLVEAWVPRAGRIPVLEGLVYITHTRSSGAAFGLFASMAPTGKLIGFALLALLAGIVIAAFYQRVAPGDRVQALGLSLVLAGAAGNFIDRIWRGGVVDLLYIQLWGGYSWPDFNVADVCIVMGVLALITDLLSREAMVRAS